MWPYAILAIIIIIITVFYREIKKAPSWSNCERCGIDIEEKNLIPQTTGKKYFLLCQKCHDISNLSSS